MSYPEVFIAWGSIEEEEMLRGFAERLKARFTVYEALELVTRWMDEGPPPEGVGSAQDPLPGLETPLCR